jgi:HAD superfamily hydrolase (TIGR01490 family)
MTELAIYDMDRTLTKRGTYTPFLIHAALRLAPWRLVLLPAAQAAKLAYAMKFIDRKRLKEINQRLLLGAHVAPRELAPVTASYAEYVMRHNLYPQALDQLARDRAAGRRLVLATASYRLYVAAIADRLGFDDVIATNSIVGLDERVSARIDGENCYGPAKLRMIEAWLANEGLQREQLRIRFYSDHASDAPVLEWADEAFAVNPHDRLAKLAKQRGWETIDWR